MEIPTRVKAILIWAIWYLVAIAVKVFVNRERAIRVMRGHVIGDRPTRNAWNNMYD